MSTRQVIGSDGSIQRLEAGRKHTMRLAKGQRVNVREVLPDGRSREADDVIATRKGGDLHLKYVDGTELTFERFYEDCAADACSVTLPGKEAAGHALDGNAAAGAALGDGEHLMYAHGDNASLMTLAGDDSALRGALSSLGTGVVSYVPAEAGSWGGIGALAALGGGLGLAAAGGGGGSAAATVASVVLKGSFVAGPVVSGHGLSVTAYKSDGTVLVTGTVNDDGSFTLEVKTGYAGPVLVVVGDRDGGADYWDEATGAPKDLTIDLRAATTITGNGTYRVNVNVFTEAAVRSLGIGVGSTTLGDYSSAEIAAANKKLTDALGMLDDLATGPAPIAVVTSSGAENQNANAYGKLLAAASGVDESGSTEATVQALLVAVAAQNPVLETSVLLLQGASNVVDKLPGFLTAAKMSLNDYFFVADAVNKLRGELAGGLEVGDYSTLKQLSDAIKALEAALGEDSPLAMTLAGLQAQIDAIIETDIAALQERIDGLAQVVTYGFAMQGGAIDGVAADLATLQGVVTALQGTVSDNAAAAQALASAQTTLQGVIDALADRVTSEAARLDALIVSNESDIADVAAELLALQGAVTMLQGTVSDNATAAAQALAAAQTTLQGAIDTLGQRVTDEVERLEGLIASNDSDISTLTSSLQSAQAQLAALAGAVNGSHDLLEEMAARVLGPYARSGGNLTTGADFRVFTHGSDTVVNLGQFGNSPGANEVVINGAGPAVSQSLRITGFTLGSEPHVSDVLRFTQLPNAQALVQQISSVSVAGRVGSDLVSVKLTFSNGGVIELIDLVPKSEIDSELVPLVSSDGSYAALPQNEIAPIVLGLAGENIVFGGDGFTFVYYQMLSQISSLRTTVDTQAAALTSLQTQITDIIGHLDVTAPTITDVTLSAAGADAEGHLNAGDVVTATVKFSEAVLVTGAPTLQLQIGADTVLATYQGGAGTDSLIFSYTILAGQTDANGISVPADALQLGAASIEDSAGNAAVVTSAASSDDAQLIVDNGPLTLSLSAGTLFGSQFTADNVLVGLLFDGGNGGYVFLSDLDADGYYHVPEGAQFIDIDDYLNGIENDDEQQYWQDHVVPGGQSAYIDLSGKLAWTYGEGLQIIVSEETLRAWLSGQEGQGGIDAYIVANTVPAEQVGQYDGFTAGETLAQRFLDQIAGHDPADVLLTVTSPLTLAQAARLAEAGFDLTNNVAYSLRDYDTTIQAAMLAPAAAAAVRGATQVTAVGDELDNAMRFTSFDGRVNLRIEGGDGNDTIDTGRGNDEIVGGRGADTINLTYKDSSQDTVIYQTLYDGKTVPVTTLTFSSDADNYREGSVLRVKVDGTEYSHTVPAGQTPAEALAAFAGAIKASDKVSDVLVHGNQLEVFGEPGAKLLVSSASTTDISNPGQKTRWDVTFPDNSSDYPDNQSLGGTMTFDRQVHVTIGGITVSADVVYDGEGAPDPEATVAALRDAILGHMALGGDLADVLGSVTVADNGSDANVVLRLDGKTVPETDGGAPTFTVSDATVDVAGQQQQTDVAFSSNNADYYEGGTLSVTIAGKTVSANMVAGSAADSLAALQAAIEAAGEGEGDLAGVLETVQHADYSLRLTAATEEVDPLQVSAATMSYAGEAQRATVTLDAAATYDQYSFVDAEGDAVSIRTEGKPAVHFEGGKAWLTITPEGDGAQSVTVSADMVSGDAEATAQALLEAIQAQIGEGGDLYGIIGDVALDGTTLTLTAAAAGQHGFSVSDSTLDYQGLNQIATAAFSTTGNDYYAGGKLRIGVKPTGGPEIAISADMVNGDADGSIAALVAAIEAEIHGAATAPVVKAGDGLAGDAAAISVRGFEDSYYGSTSLVMPFFFQDESGWIAFEARAYLQGLGDIGIGSGEIYITESGQSTVTHALTFEASTFDDGELSLNEFFAAVNEAAIDDGGAKVSDYVIFTVDDATGQVVMTANPAHKGADVEIGFTIASGEDGGPWTGLVENADPGSEGYYSAVGSRSGAVPILAAGEGITEDTLVDGNIISLEFFVGNGDETFRFHAYNFVGEGGWGDGILWVGNGGDHSPIPGTDDYALTLGEFVTWLNARTWTRGGADYALSDYASFSIENGQLVMTANPAFNGTSAEIGFQLNAYTDGVGMYVHPIVRNTDPDSEGFFTANGNAGRLDGIVSEVIEDNGVITLVSADKAKEVFTISKAEIDYVDPGEEGSYQQVTVGFDGDADSYYVVSGYDGGEGTASHIGLTLHGRTFTQTMFTESVGTEGEGGYMTAAQRTVAALKAQIDAAFDAEGDGAAYAAWLTAQVGSVALSPDGLSIVFTASEKSAADAIDLADGFMTVAPITQVSQLDFSGVAFETRTKADGTAPQVEVSIAGTTITANAVASHAGTVRNLVQEIVIARDGEGVATQIDSTASAGKLLFEHPVAGTDILGYGPVTVELIVGSNAVTFTFDPLLSDHAGKVTVAELVAAIIDHLDGTGVTVVLNNSTLEASGGNLITGNLSFSTLDFTGKTGTGDVPANLGAVAWNGADDVTLTAAAPGADPLNVSAQYQIEDTQSAHSSKHVVNLTFDDAVFDDPAQTPEGTVVTLVIDGITASVTVTADLLQGVGASLRAEAIVAALKADILAKAGESDVDVVGSVRQGYMNRGSFVAVADEGLQSGDTVLQVTAGSNGAYLLGHTTDDTLSITVIKPGNVAVHLAASAGVVQIGDIGYKWADTDVDSVIEAGRDEGRLTDTDGANPVFTVGPTVIDGDTRSLPSVLSVTDADGSAYIAPSTQQSAQTVTNPGFADGGEGFLSDAGFFGDAASSGSGHGVHQSYTNPDSSYTATSGSALMNQGGGEGDDTLHGSAPGYYDDDGLHTEYLSGAMPDGDADGDGRYLYTQRGEDDLTYVIDQDEVNAGAAATTAGLGEDAIWNAREGYAAFSWDGASTLIVTPGNAGPDLIHNFQVDHDYIALEGKLAASTLVGALDGFIGGTRTETVTLSTGDVSWSGGGDDYSGAFPTRWSIDLGIASENDSFDIDFDFSPFLHIVGTTEPGNAGAFTRLYAHLSTDPMHFDNVAAFEAYVEETFVDTLTEWDTTSALSAAEAITWSFSDGILSADVSDASLQFDNTGSVDAHLHPYSITGEVQVGTPFDLDLDEYGLVDSAHSTLGADELGDASKVAALLESLFHFGAAGEDSVLDTSIFAVTAQDDPSVTAIWGHRQSSPADGTVEAIELYQLALVNTLGGMLGDEFGLHNFQPQPVMPT